MPDNWNFEHDVYIADGTCSDCGQKFPCEPHLVKHGLWDGPGEYELVDVPGTEEY